MSHVDVTAYTNTELLCDLDVARTLVSAAPRLISAPNLPRVPVTGYTIRQPSVAELACDFPWGTCLCPANAGLNARRQAEACPTSTSQLIQTQSCSAT